MLLMLPYLLSLKCLGFLTLNGYFLMLQCCFYLLLVNSPCLCFSSASNFCRCKSASTCCFSCCNDASTCCFDNSACNSFSATSDSKSCVSFLSCSSFLSFRSSNSACSLELPCVAVSY